MEWTAEAIVLGVRAHGENGAILEALTRDHGRHNGLVRGGASRRLKPILQPGNTLHLRWRARLNEHLGSFTAELSCARAGDMLESRDALTGLNAFAAICKTVLPEREAHPEVFDAGQILLDAMRRETFSHWGPLFVRFEAGLLDTLGFGLDLSSCAASGSTDELVYVSPRSGRAVSRAAGAPYKDRLLQLPSYLLASQTSEPERTSIAAGLQLTGHFLLERVLKPHGQAMPLARLRLDGLAGRESL